MFLQKLIAVIGTIFKALFNSAKTVYNKLPDDVKDAMLHGAGIVDLINGMLDKTPAEIREAIQTQYPKLNVKQLEAAIISVLRTFNITDNINSLDDAIEALKNYLATHNGKAWANISHSIGTGLAALLAPKETKLATITSLIEFVYHRFVKKD